MEYKAKFLDFISSIQMDKDHPFESVIIYWEWKEYGNNAIMQYEYHASVSAAWYQYILGTKWFAKKYNHKHQEEVMKEEIRQSDKSVLLLDYVQY